MSLRLNLPAETTAAPESSPGVVPPPRGGLVRLNLTDVTGFNSAVEEVPRTVTVAALARSMADRWSLPTDTPWGLRNDDGLALDEDRAVGDQISGDDITLTLQPKAHLG